MGLMQQFSQPQNSGPMDVIGMARGIAGNDPRGLVQRLADSGVTCNLPDGRVMSVRDLAAMAEGKTPQQLLSALGLK
jgi:hypothetical protein